VRQAVTIAREMPGTPVMLPWSREKDIAHGLFHPVTQCKLTAGLCGGRTRGLGPPGAVAACKAEAGTLGLRRHDARRATISGMPPPPDDPIAATRRWLERAVIGLNLCPFAKAVHTKGRIRWVLSGATDAQALLEQLVDELRLLAAADPAEVETTLIVHPQVLRDFADYNDFLDLADAAIAALGLEGTLQVASFHPDYRFAGTEAGDITNATNRSPHPTLHLLREDSIAQAVADAPDADRIVERNLATLRRLGAAGWRRLLEDREP
jgi:hypothetical protein